MNTSSRKKFKSLAEAKKFLDNNQVSVNEGCDVYIQEETITHKYTKVDVNVECSKETKDFIFEQLIDSVNTREIHKNELMRAIVFDMLEKKKNPTKAFLLNEILKEYFKNEDDIDGKINDIISRTNEIVKRKKIGALRETLYNDKDMYDFYTEIKFNVKKLLLTFLTEVQSNRLGEYKFIRTQTNYKPCNAFGIEIDGIYVTIRPGDMMFSDSSTMGRNVSITGDYEINDGDMSKIKTILKG